LDEDQEYKTLTIFSYFRQNLFLIVMKIKYCLLFTILLVIQSISPLHAQTTDDFSGFFARDLSAAQNDYMQALTCYNSTVFNVLANDDITDCTLNELEISIIHGSVTGATTTINSNKNIVYFPVVGFIGRDTLEYKVTCNGETIIAKVFITVVACPDNVTTVDCSVPPLATEWGIVELKSSSTEVHYAAQPLVGDVDGCGKNEIITFNAGSSFTLTSAILIIDDNLNVKASINLGSTNCYLINALAIADVDGCGKAEIFVLTGIGTSRTLRCFWFNGMDYVNKPGFQQINTVALSSPNNDATLVIGDINGDGIPEILAYDKIFNAQTGALIATLPTGNYGGLSYYNVKAFMPVLADVDNDGVLEIVCGNMVYKAYINEGSTTLLQPVTIAYQTASGGDGATSVADIDLDGYLDVVVTSISGSLSVVYIWSPYKGVVLGSWKIISTVISRTFIGDVDNDGYPEIAFSYIEGMDCYKYYPNNPPGNRFGELWSHPTTDLSGFTAMTMFDFNQDGKQEIVYRDQSNLRIMDGETGLNIATFNCCAGTAGEYPIVVDFTGEGYAQIVVTGSYLCVGPTYTQSLRLYGSSVPGAWAPARKVWNQYAYNSVNINEDLTVPRFQMNPATIFPGPDDILGTADDIRPFNGFLMQQTLLNQMGASFWITPNIVWNTKPSMTITGNSAVFKGCIKNIGDAALQAPIYVTYYKNDTITANIIALNSIQRTLAAGDTLCFTFTIHNWNIYEPVDSVWISLNDRNGIYPYQQQCVVDGRRIAIDKTSHSAMFYANNVLCDTLFKVTFCDKNVHFRAEVEGEWERIKWFINNIEEPDGLDNLQWSKTFEPGEHLNMPVKVEVLFANDEILSKVGILNVRAFWTKIKNIRH